MQDDEVQARAVRIVLERPSMENLRATAGTRTPAGALVSSGSDSARQERAGVTEGRLTERGAEKARAGKGAIFVREDSEVRVQLRKHPETPWTESLWGRSSMEDL